MTDDPRRYGLIQQAVTAPDELELAQRISERIDLIDQLIEKWAKVASVKIHAGSQLALDDEYTAWRHLSHTVSGGINLAVDNLRAFRDLVRPGTELVFPQFAHYPILRAALEGSSLSLWVIAPEDPKLRIRRLLRAATAELEDEDVLARQMLRGIVDDPDFIASNAAIDKSRKQVVGRHRKHANQIRSVSRRLGLEDPGGAGWTVGYAEIVRDATAATGIKSYHGEIVWRLISGLAHPSLMRATTRSNIEELVDNADGTFNGLMTTDLGLTKTALEAAWVSTNEAIIRLGERKIRLGDRINYTPN